MGETDTIHISEIKSMGIWREECTRSSFLVSYDSSAHTSDIVVGKITDEQPPAIALTHVHMLE